MKAVPVVLVFTHLLFPDAGQKGAALQPQAVEFGVVQNALHETLLLADDL